jgi:hypothetical protein
LSHENAAQVFVALFHWCLDQSWGGKSYDGIDEKERQN